MSKNEEVKVEYYENGNKKSEEHYKDGKPNGVWTWYEDGSKESEYTYKDGEPSGVWTYWYKDGTEMLKDITKMENL